MALETSSALGGAAVGAAGALFGEVVLGPARRHAETLFPAIHFLLQSLDWTPADLTAVVVGDGPGSFTGIRIAAAAAKALAGALGLPLYAVPSLAGVAAGIPVSDRPVAALLDARRMEVYAACYRFAPDGGRETLLAPLAAPVESVVRRLRPHDPMYVGEGAQRYAAAIRAAGGTVGNGAPCSSPAAALLWLVAREGEGLRVASPQRWEPRYLRATGAERVRFR